MERAGHAQSRQCQQPVRVYRFLRDECGAQFIQFIPIVERRHVDGVPYGDTVTERSITAEQYGQFLVAVFEESGYGAISAKSTCRCSMWRWPTGMANPRDCVSSISKTCGTTLALEHNGDLYSCDHFVEPQHKLGNIHETHMIELVASDQQVKFGHDKFDTLPKYCLECDVRFTCHGGCPKDRFITTPAGEPGLNSVCGLQAILPSHQPAYAVDGAIAAPKSRSVRTHTILCNEESRVAGAPAPRPTATIPAPVAAAGNSSIAMGLRTPNLEGTYLKQQ